MRTLVQRLMLLLTPLLLIALVAQNGEITGLVGAAVAAMACAVAIRYAAGVLRSRDPVVRSRSFARRRAMSAAPAPSHPATPGRTRSRAPAGGVMATP